jgi:O-antigen/teichoic acid export membrane protein
LIESILKETGKDALRYVPAKVVPAVVNFIGLLIFTHIFSAEDYGNYFLTLTTITAMNMIGSNWVNNSTLRFYPEFKLKDNLNEFFSNIFFSFAISNGLITLIFLLGFFFLQSYLPKELIPFFRLGMFSYLSWATYLMLLYFLRSSLQATAFSKFEIFSSSGKFVLALVLVFFLKIGALSLLWGMLLVNFVLVIFISKRLSLFKRLDKTLFSLKVSLDFLKYGFPLALSSLSAWLLILSDRYILQYFKTAKDVGIYSVSFSVVDRSIGLLYSILMLAAYPIIVLTWEAKGKKITQQLIGELSRYFLILCIPVFIGISILGEDIFTLFVGKEFTESYRLVPLFAFCAIAQGLFQYVGKSFELCKKTLTLTLVFFMAGLVNILLNIFLIPSHGYMGAGIAKSISFVTLLIIGIGVSYSFMPWLVPLKSLAKVIISTTFMGAVLIFLKKSLNTSLENLIFLASVGVCVYSILLLLFKEIRKNELDFVKSFGHKVVKTKFIEKHINRKR